jgi:hypothetical protein
MIWHELWPFVLAVVLGKERTRKWVSQLCTRSRVHGDRYPVLCECSNCVATLDFAHEWVRIQ